MVTEDYVSFETAKLLKEKGFPQSTFRCHYITDGNSHYKSFENRCGFGDFDIIAPTQAMTMRWLREVHKIFIAINIIPHTTVTMEQRYYFFKLFKDRKHYNFPLNYSVKYYPSYEQACEAALKYTLENLI